MLKDNFLYKIVNYTVSGGGFCSETITYEELKKHYSIIGVNSNQSNRKELQGQPKLEMYLGPMFDGQDDNGHTIIRYESNEVYQQLSV